MTIFSTTFDLDLSTADDPSSANNKQQPHHQQDKDSQSQSDHGLQPPTTTLPPHHVPGASSSLGQCWPQLVLELWTEPSGFPPRAESPRQRRLLAENVRLVRTFFTLDQLLGLCQSRIWVERPFSLDSLSGGEVGPADNVGLLGSGGGRSISKVQDSEFSEKLFLIAFTISAFSGF